MSKQEYTIEELIKAEGKMQYFIADEFLRFVANDDNLDFLMKEYKTSNPEKIKQLVIAVEQNIEWGLPLDAMHIDYAQSFFEGIKFSLEDILAYIDDPKEFEAEYKMELSPHVLNFQYMNEYCVREFVEREYVKQIMKKFKEIPGYDFKTAMEDMTELMKAA